MTRFAALLLALAACAAPPAPVVRPPAEPPPNTDIYLAPLSMDGGGVRIGRPENVTHRPGYDNQPAWTPEGGSLLFTRVGDDAQADIFRYTLASDRTEQLTRTPGSEYSATPLPDGGFSAVRVEADSTQRLWRFDARGENPRLVLRDVRPVGYHAWADAHTLALYVLGEPSTLQLADTRTGTARIVARDIGRSLNPIPGGRTVSFVQHLPDSTSTVSELDPATGSTRALVRAPPGADFHAWTPDGTLLITAGSALYAWRRGNAGWTAVADLAPLRLSRLAVSPGGDRIAIVGEGR